MLTASFFRYSVTVALAIAVAATPIASLAQCTTTPCFGAESSGLEDGIDEASNIEGPVDEEDIRVVILRALTFVLDFLALAALIAIVIAGVLLIVSGGAEEQKDRAKRIIFYVIVGLLIIIFARLIVSFFITAPFLRT